MFAVCRICGRRLKDPESIRRNIGPTCDLRLHPHDRHITITHYEDFEWDEVRQYKLFDSDKYM
jgi:hypothetical protein